MAKNSSCIAEEPLEYIMGGFKELSSSLTLVFQALQDGVQDVLPGFDRKLRDEMVQAFLKYNLFLGEMQQFISYSLTQLEFAETLKHLCDALPQDVLIKLIDDAKALIDVFARMETEIKCSRQFTNAVKDFANYKKKVQGFMAGLMKMGSGLGLIGGGLCLFLGAVPVLVTLAGAGVTAVAVGGLGYKYGARPTKEYGQYKDILSNLQKLQDCLVDIQNEQRTLQGTGKGLEKLRDSNRSTEMENKIIAKKLPELVNILMNMRQDVEKGYLLLKQHSFK
ncbi:uncharacterized protein LOC129588934 [Paramacrobiotus metropolitanus]|uniref:uncharacterized protein LOC129588934 n=1 Tax=Paramacrobiotus metropolitanus TaxID=2943436 RepID=UPI002445FD75|nr:uncharacterized protein LOC129588934 [Paramacrobiotus metropolitanus]